MTHPALAAGRVAVITGAAMGIGLAAAMHCAEAGMKICLVDVDEDELDAAEAAVIAAAAKGQDDVMALTVDVSDAAAMLSLKAAVYSRFGEAALLMNNAVTRLGGGALENPVNWRRAVDVNLLGVVNGCQAFVPAMIAQGTAALVVNTGSKQGVTNPPGNTAYNVMKAAVKAYTEALQHELRNTDNCQVTAHLLIPGWTTTGKREHKPGAWLPRQVVEAMVAALGEGDFYILCADDEVTPEMDRQRILWAAGDITENRPPLSRWHEDYRAAFADFAK